MRTDLIFLPGFGYRASVFSHLAPYFPEYQLHFADLPPLNEAALITFAQQLPARSVLAGWSLGGLIAIQLCAKFPERFEKLVLLASTPKFLAATDWPGIHPDNFSHLKNSLQDFHKLVCFPSRTARQHFANHTGDAPLTSLDYLYETDCRREYASLSQPVLSIAGDRDAILPASGTEHIQGAGHALFYTHAAEVCSRIRNFLEAG